MHTDSARLQLEGGRLWLLEVPLRLELPRPAHVLGLCTYIRCPIKIIFEGASE